MIAMVAVLAALYRLYECTLTPADSDDLVRHLFYGLYIARDGLAAAGKTLLALDPRLVDVGWSQVAYNYPIVAVAFFTLLAKTSATLFTVKLTLTVLEALNAVLVGHTSGQRLLALLYWISPLSIWRVSREGNFEPLQSFFILASIASTTRAPVAAALWLGLGIQTKLTAAALLPWFLWTVLKQQAPKTVSRVVLVLLASFLPSLYAQLHYPMLQLVAWSGRSLRFNPYYWNPGARAAFTWTPPLVILLNELVSYGFLALLLVGLARTRSWREYSAALIFSVWVKVSPLVQPWYLLTAPALTVTLTSQASQVWLFALAGLLDPLSLAQLILGPVGLTIGTKLHGISAFTQFIVPAR